MVGTLIVATIYLQLIQNRYMFRSFTVLQCSPHVMGGLNGTLGKGGLLWGRESVCTYRVLLLIKQATWRAQQVTSGWRSFLHFHIKQRR